MLGKAHTMISQKINEGTYHPRKSAAEIFHQLVGG
jgi:hypothetical protein